MLGRSLVQAFKSVGRLDVVGLTRADFDLRQAGRLEPFLKDVGATTVIHCAAKVGGIGDNVSHPVEYLQENLVLDNAVIMSSVNVGVRNFLYLGSSCMYPKDLPKTLQENDLLSAALEPTNEGYALAKIVGGKLCEYISRQYGKNYRTIIASNLYGPGDNFNPESSHLVASVVRKTIQAVETHSNSIDVWGDGKARREFTYVEDLAAWIVGVTDSIPDLPQYLNVGAGVDYSVDDYYTFAMQALGVELKLIHNLSKPRGMQSKLMDSTLAMSKFEWNPQTDILKGISSVIENLTR